MLIYKRCVKVVTWEKESGSVHISLKEAEPGRKLSTESNLITDREKLCLSSDFTAFYNGRKNNIPPFFSYQISGLKW